MKTIKLFSLRIDNFKGIKSHTVKLNGSNATFEGQNGAKKTTVYDSFLWLLFGKDSTGRTAFGVRPLDSNNQPIKGLVTCVEAELTVDGALCVLKKELHENVVKKQIRGYTTECTIDEVPKKVSEYSEYIEEIIPAESFKMLTDTHHFNDKLHWTERRKVLFDVAGEIGTPEGFEKLIAAMNGRSVEDYKKVLANQKKRLEEERDEINPRIDEIQRGLDSFAGASVNEASLELNRSSIESAITKLDEHRQTLFDTEKERQTKIEKRTSLITARARRESELDNDVSALKKYYDEKAEIEQSVASRHGSVVLAQNALSSAERALKNDQQVLSEYQNQLEIVRKARGILKDADLSGEKCTACGQVLPADRIAELEAEQQKRITANTTRGNEVFAEIKECKASIEKAQTEINTRKDALEKAEIELREAQEYKQRRSAEIDEILSADRPAVDYAKDDKWNEITSDILGLEKSIGESMSAQLQSIDNDRTAKQNELAKINAALAQSDNMKKAAARIIELENKEKELAQQIADVEQQLADIDAYKAAESKMIENAVNGKFKYVTFKLFNQNLNGSYEDTCEAIYNGTPYSDMSCGEKIFVGLDIINTLSAHYGLSVPIFIDNAESLTLPIELDSQVIRLVANIKVKKLKVSLEEQHVTAAA